LCRGGFWVVFSEMPLAGAFVVDVEPIADERGFFARTWCQREFAERGLETRVAQCRMSFNARAGTLRGLHYQAAPHEEVKVVRCTSGSIFDVIVDLRPHSPTYSARYVVTLSALNRRCCTCRAASFMGLRRSRMLRTCSTRCRTRTRPSLRGLRDGTIRPSASSGPPLNVELSMSGIRRIRTSALRFRAPVHERCRWPRALRSDWAPIRSCSSSGVMGGISSHGGAGGDVRRALG
jgi:dTDP-4-dehydrorhamnose 3,5-epimerase-like enzyme